MKTCSFPHKFGMDITWSDVISACSDWEIISDKGIHLGAGSYGDVTGAELLYKGKKKNVAIKTIVIQPKTNTRLKNETLREFDYVNQMDTKNIGPRVYEDLWLEYKDVDIAVILMERFQMNGAHALSNPLITKSIKKKILRKMIKLTHAMLDVQMYCYDIKPNNFVVNLKPLKVRMIDFGGQFCEDKPRKVIAHLREEVKGYMDVPFHHQGGHFRTVVSDIWGRDMSDDLMTITKLKKGYADKIFFTLIMIPLILESSRYLSAHHDVLEIFRPFLYKLCRDKALQIAMGVFVVSDPPVFLTFSHYTAPFIKPHHNFDQKRERLLFFKRVIDRVCDLLKDIHIRRPRRSRRARRSRRSRRTRHKRRRHH